MPCAPRRQMMFAIGFTRDHVEKLAGMDADLAPDAGLGVVLASEFFRNARLGEERRFAIFFLPFPEGYSRPCQGAL